MTDRYVLTRYTDAKPAGEVVFDSEPHNVPVIPKPIPALPPNPPTKPPVFGPSPVQIGVFPPAFQRNQFEGREGVSYCFPIPKTPLGDGLVSFNAEGLSGVDIQMEVSLSTQPGDFDECRKFDAPASFGRMVYPYYVAGVGCQIAWVAAPNPITGAAYIPRGPNEDWFLNLRFTKGSGEVYFQWSHQ